MAPSFFSNLFPIILGQNQAFYFQGYGEQAIYVLDRLSDEALRATNFQWGRPVPPQVIYQKPGFIQVFCASLNGNTYGTKYRLSGDI